MVRQAPPMGSTIAARSGWLRAPARSVADRQVADTSSITCEQGIGGRWEQSVPVSPPTANDRYPRRRDTRLRESARAIRQDSRDGKPDPSAPTPPGKATS